MAAEPEPPVLQEGRVIVPGSGRQLAAFGLFPPPRDQHRVLPSGSATFAVRASGPELLWISFNELCAPGPAAEDYILLADGRELWVIDGVPAPDPSDAGPRAEAWEQFAAVLAVLAARRVAVFVVGSSPMDWAAMAAQTGDAGLRSVLAEIDRLLARLKRVESDEGVAVEGVSGS